MSLISEDMRNFDKKIDAQAVKRVVGCAAMLLFLCLGTAKETSAETLEDAMESMARVAKAMAPLGKEKCGSNANTPCTRAMSEELTACINSQSSGDDVEKIEVCAKTISDEWSYQAGSDVTVTFPDAKEDVPDAMGYMVKGPDIDVESLRDPFVSPMSRIAERNAQLLLQKQAKLGKRNPEKLEAFSLSELKLVAIYSMGKDRVALIQDNIGNGYKVRRNNYMGKDSGRVEKITEDSILLIESALDLAGDLVEREVVLTLKEVNE